MKVSDLTRGYMALPNIVDMRSLIETNVDLVFVGFENSKFVKCKHGE